LGPRLSSGRPCLDNLAVVSDSLWNMTAEELLGRASSADPTPGGGAIAALTGAFGFGLVLMAIAVSVADAGCGAGVREQLLDAQVRARELQDYVAGAVDRDVAEFDAVMAAYRLPRDGDAERAARGEAIDAATVTATHGPLGLAEAAIRGIALADEVEPLVKPSIVSDARAGRDLLRGAALAAVRTADINLAALEQRGHADAPSLRQRRDAAGDAIGGVGESG
jgi:formiminotetrahydrofolate cyclodeaminase